MLQAIVLAVVLLLLVLAFRSCYLRCGRSCDSGWLTPCLSKSHDSPGTVKKEVSVGMCIDDPSIVPQTDRPPTGILFTYMSARQYNHSQKRKQGEDIDDGGRSDVPPLERRWREKISNNGRERVSSKESVVCESDESVVSSCCDLENGNMGSLEE
jgi:hypothetical protein